MKLTLKELQKTVQEQIDTMNTQLQKSKREEYELHERADSHLLNMDAFRKETAFNFREVRTEMAEFRTELKLLKADVAELKVDVAELKVDVAELKVDVAELKTGMRQLQEEMRAGFAAILAYAERIDFNHEARITALECKSPN